MADPFVTIVVVPRERFSFTRESLGSIYEHTEIPFNLVYVDGGSPPQLRHYLEAQARERAFQLIRTDHYLSPNQARNLGLAQVSSQYVVFIDNDVVVTPGWLGPLVQYAEETGASVVGPLICQGEPVHEIVHFAGGEARILVENTGEQVRRRIHEKILMQGRRVLDVRQQLQRQQTELGEFHCMLVRTEVFEQLGPLDEALMNTREHVDFCITVSQAGGTVYFEPASLVTFVPGPPLEWSDVPFYMLRWSDAWELASLHHLRDKWNLSEDKFFTDRYKRLGWRRQMTLIKPLVRSVLGRGSRRVEKLLFSIDKKLNRYLTNRYVQRQAQTKPQLHKSPVTASSH